MPYINKMQLVKTITAKVFQPTARKRRALDALWRSWRDALGSKRDYTFLRESCREINWKIKKGADAPVGVPKDALKLRPGGVFAPWFASIPTPDGRVNLPLRMSRGHSRLLAEGEVCDSQLIRRGREYNADLNGAVNIGSRALAYMAIAGAPGIAPLRGTTSPQVQCDATLC